MKRFLQALFGRKIAMAAKARKPHKVRLGLEGLEDRLLPVVGLSALPPLAGGAYPAVCQVLQPGFDGNGWYGSGALLFDGQHVLTAAHMVDEPGPNGVGNGKVDPVTFTVSFDNGSIYQVPASNVVIAPGWDGNAEHGNDLAIIDLGTKVPGITGYDLNVNPNEGGQLFTMVGYGVTGVGQNGVDYTKPDVYGSAGVKRYAMNVFDPPASTDKVLTFSLTANVPAGVDPAIGEGITDHGDSGGPSLLNGRIAGVCSTGPGSFEQVGSQDTDTRVYPYVAWINGAIGTPYVTVDLNNPLFQRNGPRTISVGFNAFLPNAMCVTINGQVVSTVDLGRVGSAITILDSNAGDTLSIDAALNRYVFLDGVVGQLDVDGRHYDGEGGNANVTITNTDVIFDGQGTVPFHTDVNYSGAENLAVYTSNTDANDNQPINNVTVTSLSVPTTLDDGNSTNNITVGDANGSLDALCGTNSFLGSSGHLTVRGANGASSDDSITIQEGAAATAYSESFVLTDGQVTCSNSTVRFGLVFHTFTLTYSGLVPDSGAGITVQGGPGGSRFTVLSTTTGVFTKVIGGAGANTFTIGDSSHSLLSIGAPLESEGGVHIDGGSGQSALILDDTAGVRLLGSPSAPAYEITSEAVNYTPALDVFTVGQSAPSLSFFYKNIQNLTLDGGQGGSEFDIESAPSTLTVHGGTGNNSFIVGAPGLTGLRSVFLNGGGQSSIVINDQADGTAAPAIYSVYSSQVVVGSTNISFFNDPGDPKTVSLPGLFSQVTLKTANGRQLVYVYDTASAAATTIDLGTGDQDVNINRLERIVTLTVHGNSGHDNLLISDFADPQFERIGPDFIITPTNVSEQDAGAGVTYDGFAGLVVTGTSLDDVFTVEGTAAGVSTTLIGGGGNDTLDYSLYVGDVTVDLPLGTATGISGGIGGFRNVTGGLGNNILVGDGTGNTLTALVGHNLLIAGPGPGTLAGGLGNDILVGGSTAYDTNPDALAAIMAEWARTDVNYATRVNDLLYGGGLNGSTVLNPTTFTQNAGGNTLQGNLRTTGLDLFYGSLARDTNDWNQASGEVFVDPDTFQAPTNIDAAALAGTSITVDGIAHDSTAPLSTLLMPGQHSLQASGGDAVSFTVADDGTVDYDPALDGILSGRGTSSLVINGLAVTVDATALGAGLPLTLDGAAFDGTAPFTVQVLPGTHSLQPGGGDPVSFTVAADGTVDYDPSLDTVLSGRGGSTLTIDHVLTPLAQLREDHGFHYLGSYYQNSSGADEKWFEDRNNNWFALLSTGALIQWNGKSFASSMENPLAYLHPSTYADPSQLFDAPVNVSSDAVAQLSQLRETYGFHYVGSYSQNSAGENEKWFEDRNNHWFALLPTGALIQWDGKSFAGSMQNPLANLDRLVYDDPGQLFNAPVSLSADVVAQLPQLRETYGFHYVGGYSLNSAGANEKWFEDRSNHWFALLPTGALIQWNGKNFAASMQNPLANLDPLVYDDPSQLFNAPVSLSADVVAQLTQLRQTYGFHSVGSYYQNSSGANEKWFQDRDNHWFFLLPSGALAQWDDKSLASSMQNPLANLDSLVYDDPGQLFNAPVSLSDSLQGELSQLEQTYGFHNAGSYYQNSSGANEKWFQDRSGGWYAILAGGDIIKWDGKSIASSDNNPVASLGQEGALVFDDPTLIFKA